MIQPATLSTAADRAASRRLLRIDVHAERRRPMALVSRRRVDRRPDLRFELLRGNVPTRLRKFDESGLDGVILAYAGLNRLATDSLRSLAERGIVQPKFIDTLLTSLLPAHPGYYGELVWILSMLELWLRNHAPDFRANP